MAHLLFLDARKRQNDLATIDVMKKNINVNDLTKINVFGFDPQEECSLIEIPHIEQELINTGCLIRVGITIYLISLHSFGVTMPI